MKLIEDLGMHYANSTSKRKCRYGVYECPKCTAHVKCMAQTGNKPSSHCKSCATSKASVVHGNSYHALYAVWKSEKARCENPKNTRYHRYGARGIIVVKELQDFKVWVAYVESLQNAYTKGYSIDRINNDGNYAKGNLRWADASTQAYNKEPVKNKTTNLYGISKRVYKSGTVRYIATCISNYIGMYSSKKEAAEAYNEFVRENSVKRPLNTGEIND